MYKFNNDNIFTGYLKQLLKDVNLPSCKKWFSGMPVFKGCHYLTDDKLYIAKQNGVFYDIDDTENFEPVCTYYFNKELDNLTRNFEIDGMVYSHKAHTFLGDSLRFYRDFKGIDLMSMYNCFSNEMANNLNYKTRGGLEQGGLTLSVTNGYKIYAVPVRYFQTYTIAIDCSSAVELFVGFYSADRFVKMDNLGHFIEDSHKVISGTTFNEPVEYDFLSADSLRNNTYFDRSKYLQEKNLKLFIKVPELNNSSIVVLEGKYKNSRSFYFDENSSIKVPYEVCSYDRDTKREVVALDGKEHQRKYNSFPQLLYCNDTEQHPFADRLIEYLCGNVVSPNDKILKNTLRIKERLIQRYKDGQLGIPYVIGSAGVYDDYTRSVVYDITRKANLFSKLGNNWCDTLGYLDKDAEQVLGEVHK
jgi:hypothetical protein